MKDSEKVKFYLDKTGFFAESAVILLLQSVIFRIIGCWGIWADKVNGIMLLALPVCCCLLMVLCILLFGNKGFFLSIIPVMLGVVFFVYKALSFDNWLHTLLCVLLYLVVVMVYTGTVCGWIPTKWLLPPLIGLPLLYQIAVEDLPALANTAQPVTFADGMQEMSILGILAALFCVGMGLRKRVVAQPAETAPAPVQPEPAPIQPVPAPVQPAPQPPVQESAVIQSACVESAPEEAPFLSEEPYTPVLTLDPDPVELEPDEGKSDGESAHE